MIHQKEKNKLGILSNALIDYFLSVNIVTFNVEINYQEEQSFIIIAGLTAKLPEGINEVIEQLNLPRDKSCEDYYEQLLLMNDGTVNLSLLATMIDEASVNYTNDILSITLIRKK